MSKKKMREILSWGINGCACAVLRLAGIGICALVAIAEEGTACPGEMSFDVLDYHAVGDSNCVFRIDGRTLHWMSIPLKDYFRQTGGWSEGKDGQLCCDFCLECTKKCELNTFSLSASFLMEPVVGCEWAADGKIGVLPKESGANIALGSGRASSFSFPLPNGEKLRVDFKSPVKYSAQDNRRWGKYWGVKFGENLSRRTYVPGDVVRFEATLSVKGGLRLKRPIPITIREGDRWVKLDYRKDPVKGSALDWSDMGLQDAPAGKHGWLKNVCGHFEFEGRPGVEQRFYGVNLCGEANYPGHADAEMLVERFVRCGYNAVRVHHHDDRWAKDADSHDRLDYLVAQCLKRGIYVTTDLYVSRQARRCDIGLGNDESACGTEEYKRTIAKQDLAFRDWCAFTEQFMKHRNPYTGRMYLDEPGIPLVSLVNEGGADRTVWERCSAFVRSLGSRALLTNDNNGSQHGEGQGLTPLYDYVDNHFYVDHPEYPERLFGLPSRFENKNPIQTGGPGIFRRGWAKGASKPYTITEWNFAGPGRYRAVGGILTGALAAEQGWDGLWRFNYSHTTADWRDSPKFWPGYFNVSTDPLMAASDRAGISLFLRRDAENGTLSIDKSKSELLFVSPRTCGFFTKGGSIAAGSLSAIVTGAPATIWVSSLDGQSLDSSSRLLLVHLTDVQGEGSRFLQYSSQSQVTLLAWGWGSLAEVGAAEIELAVKAPETYTVYGLDMAGNRIETLPASTFRGVLSFGVSTRGSIGGRIFYEIVRNQ